MAPISWGYPHPTSFEATRIVCLECALARLCTISVVMGPSSADALRASMAPGKGMEDKNNPSPHFSGEAKDWPPFKDMIPTRADRHDTTWLFEGERSLAAFFARQIKDKSANAAAGKKAFKREIASAKTDSNHKPTSIDAYKEKALTG